MSEAVTASKLFSDEAETCDECMAQEFTMRDGRTEMRDSTT